MYRKYIVEGFGTFILSLTILAAVTTGGLLPLPVPVIAGLVVMLFVYSIGSISGCHINPSVTLALLSVNKISVKEAFFYVASQFIGALLAIYTAYLFGVSSSFSISGFSGKIFFAEMLGAFVFNFGIASVVYGKAKEQMSGLVIGGSLILGIVVAVLCGSLGVLNPAVALTLNVFSPLYILAPVTGAVFGMNMYKFLSKE